MRIGVLGGYRFDFDRLDRPEGAELHYIDRDSAHLRIRTSLDVVVVVARFVNHKHWKQLRAARIPTVVVQGGWSTVNKTIESLAKRAARGARQARS